jgi:hypothetical protein
MHCGPGRDCSNSPQKAKGRNSLRNVAPRYPCFEDPARRPDHNSVTERNQVKRSGSARVSLTFPQSHRLREYARCHSRDSSPTLLKAMVYSLLLRKISLPLQGWNRGSAIGLSAAQFLLVEIRRPWVIVFRWAALISSKGKMRKPRACDWAPKLSFRHQLSCVSARSGYESKAVSISSWIEYYDES